MMMSQEASQDYVFNHDLRYYHTTRPQEIEAELNLTINWIRRSRVDSEWRDGVGIPLGEESELYEVDILDGGNVVRTIEVISPTASYTAAEQTTDFGSAQSSLDVKIYQLSAVVGRGYAAEATIQWQ